MTSSGQLGPTPVEMGVDPGPTQPLLRESLSTHIPSTVARFPTLHGAAWAETGPRMSL